MEYQIMTQTHRCKHIYKPLQAHSQTKVCKRASTSPAQEKLFFKISFPSKNFKTASALPNSGQKRLDNDEKINNDRGCKTWTKNNASSQQSIKNIGQTRVSESSALLTNFLLGGQISAPKALRFFIQSRWRSLEQALSSL